MSIRRLSLRRSIVHFLMVVCLCGLLTGNRSATLAGAQSETPQERAARLKREEQQRQKNEQERQQQPTNNQRRVERAPYRNTQQLFRSRTRQLEWDHHIFSRRRTQWNSGNKSIGRIVQQRRNNLYTFPRRHADDIGERE